MVGVGVVGYGYWGPNIVRNFAESPEAKVVCVCDQNPKRLNDVRFRYPSVTTLQDYQEMLNHPDVEAVAIATPVSSHFELALRALQAGKHVLVEKPLARTSEHCVRLIDEAVRRQRVLMVDHTFLYTGAVAKIRDLILNQELGDIYYYDSVRVNLGLIQHDVNVLWDLAVHDLSILDHVVSARPRAVSATGLSHLSNRPETIAYMTLFFDAPLIAHIHVNWLAPVKVRRTLIGGSRKMIVYDDLEPSEKIKVYDKGITVQNNPDSIHQIMVNYRTGDMYAPQLDRTEALQTEVRHFLRYIQNGGFPSAECETAVRVVRILEAASQSINHQGKLVKLPTLEKMAA